MKAIVVLSTGDGGPKLVWQDVSDVQLGPNEVLVDVRASAVNRADLAQARGNYPPPPGVTDILGLEMSGVVAATGVGVSGWSPGDRVLALLPGGGYAEQVAVHKDMLLRLPDGWDFTTGAAVPEAWYTAFVNLFLEGGLVEGETVLIHAGGSGVGTAAIQLARAAGAVAITTAGTDDKTQACRELGAVLAINYRDDDFEAVVTEVTKGSGVDLVLDPVGAPYLEKNLRVLKPLGRMVSIGLLGGGIAQVDLGIILGKRLRLIGSRLRDRPLAEKIEITRQFTSRFWPGLVLGDLRPIIDVSFTMKDAQGAHDYVRRNLNIGKVILVNG
jgi:tumor protein p53-inducible protein 3